MIIKQACSADEVRYFQIRNPFVDNSKFRLEDAIDSLTRLIDIQERKGETVFLIPLQFEPDGIDKQIRSHFSGYTFSYLRKTRPGKILVIKK